MTKTKTMIDIKVGAFNIGATSLTQSKGGVLSGIWQGTNLDAAIVAVRREFPLATILDAFVTYAPGETMLNFVDAAR